MKQLLLTALCSLCLASVAAAEPFETDHFKTKNGKELSITCIKHGSLLITYDGRQIQVDPVSDYADYTVFPKADLILITHEHHDHLDAKAIAACEQPNTTIIANENSRNKLGKGFVMRNGDVLSPTQDIQIEAVAAYNTTPDRMQFHPKERDNGYLLTVGGTRIYIAGDTEPIPEMNQLGEIDIAFLPVNQPYTMTLAQAEEAARIINPVIFYPYHYGETPIDQLRESLKDTPIEVRIRQLQ